jgi:hypothetical protein
VWFIQVISVALRFGDHQYHFESRFSPDAIQQALDIAVSIAVASADPNALVYKNSILIHGVLIQSQSDSIIPVSIGDGFLSQSEEVLPADPVGVTAVAPLLDYFINQLIDENSDSFAVGRGLWKITMDFKFKKLRYHFFHSYCLIQCL